MTFARARPSASFVLHAVAEPACSRLFGCCCRQVADSLLEEKLEDCEKHLRSKDAGKTRAAMMSQLEQWVPEVRRFTLRPAIPSGCARLN